MAPLDPLPVAAAPPAPLVQRPAPAAAAEPLGAASPAGEAAPAGGAAPLSEAAPLGESGPGASAGRTIWGLDISQLHVHFWAHRGVQVVPQGERSQIVRQAELYLLMESGSLALFPMDAVVDSLNWVAPQALFIRLHQARRRQYAERAVTDAEGRFVRFQRLYDASSDIRLARVLITPDRQLAQVWQSAPDVRTAWRRIRRLVPRHDRAVLSVDGAVYTQREPDGALHFVRDLQRQWSHPGSTIRRAGRLSGQVFVDDTSQVEGNARFVGPVWIGAGRRVESSETLIGPALLWDDPARRPALQQIQWLDIEPSEAPPQPRPRGGNLLDRAFKRGFDIVFALVVLALTMPLYPFIMLAIWLEDRGPVFFGHRRETLGGREFPCIKFRSMRLDAEKMKESLKSLNQADGPQFFIARDPRLTAVGAFIRKYDLDELPQFINVLLGDMSVVGPRPSPRNENQYCPAWREARLSVRPGITGLWQIQRTRQAGADFQEWIKYDIQYVENRSALLDLWIIWKTFVMLVRKATRS